MSSSALREAQADLASQKILDGAAQAFIELGVSGAGMADIARFSGCSRGTLYRYFKNRHELHMAFVADRALLVVAELRSDLDGVEGPHERSVETVMRAVALVRSRPELAAWFEPDESGATARMSRGSEVVSRVADAFVVGLQGAEGDEASNRLRAQYLVRIIVSFLAMPAQSVDEEREMISRFVVPSLLAT